MKIRELFRRDKNVCENEKPKTKLKLRDFLKTRISNAVVYKRLETKIQG